MIHHKRIVSRITIALCSAFLGLGLFHYTAGQQPKTIPCCWPCHTVKDKKIGECYHITSQGHIGDVKCNADQEGASRVDWCIVTTLNSDYCKQGGPDVLCATEPVDGKTQAAIQNVYRTKGLCPKGKMSKYEICGNYAQGTKCEVVNYYCACTTDPATCETGQLHPVLQNLPHGPLKQKCKK